MKNIIKTAIASFVMFLVFNVSFAGGQNEKETIKIKTSAVCGMCKDRIEKNMAFEKGVYDIVLDVPTKIATITYNPKKTDPDKLRHAIAKLGYDADDVKADKEAFNKLPKCCQKDSQKL